MHIWRTYVRSSTLDAYYLPILAEEGVFRIIVCGVSFDWFCTNYPASAIKLWEKM